jgi:nitrite reductase (NADH) small subunit
MTVTDTVSDGTLLVDLDDIPVGEGRTFTLGDEQVAVFRVRSAASGEIVVRAVSAVCPHRGGPIADGQTDGAKVVCPLHLHAYDLSDGQSLTGQPALKVYETAIEAGKVRITAP